MKPIYIFLILFTDLAYGQFEEDNFLNVGFLDAYDDVLRRSRKYAWSSFFLEKMVWTTATEKSILMVLN